MAQAAQAFGGVRELEKTKNEKGDAARQNIRKQAAKAQNFAFRLCNARSGLKIVSGLAKARQIYAAIGDLGIAGMLKCRHLPMEAAQQGL
jgi:putative transposase